ncbi:unnamed protein product, partial [Iphiclides podalirius]
MLNEPRSAPSQEKPSLRFTLALVHSSGRGTSQYDLVGPYSMKALTDCSLTSPVVADITQSQLLCRGVTGHKVCGLRAHAPRISFTNKEEPECHEIRRKSATSRLGSSPRSSIASEDRVDGLALRVPTPRGSVSSTSSVGAGSRIARLLTQGVRGTPEEANADAPRRLSWERRDSAGQLPRSASIDSVVEAAICARHSEPSQTLTLQLPARADRALSLVSPAVGRRAKSQRGQAENCGMTLTLKTSVIGTRAFISEAIKNDSKKNPRCTCLYATAVDGIGNRKTKLSTIPVRLIRDLEGYMVLYLCLPLNLCDLAETGHSQMGRIELSLWSKMESFPKPALPEGTGAAEVNWEIECDNKPT